MDNQPLRLVFAGTPEFAASHLQALLDARFNVVSVYSQPDRPAGRGKKLKPTPVKAVALEHQIEVLQPDSLKSQDAIDTLRAFEPDVMVVVAYGLLLPPEVLALPRFGCINVHASLLPRWRGAAPIERAIMAGDAETGVSIMRMDAGLDTGPVLSTARVPITDQDNSQSLGDKLSRLGCETLCAALNALPVVLDTASPQDEARACYARKISKSEALVHWSEPAVTLHNLSRALYPRSPSWFMHEGKRLRIIESAVIPGVPGTAPGTVLDCNAVALDVACGSGGLRITRLQPEGKAAMDIGSLLNGRPGLFAAGMQLDTPAE